MNVILPTIRDIKEILAQSPHQDRKITETGSLLLSSETYGQLGLIVTKCLYL